MTACDAIFGTWRADSGVFLSISTSRSRRVNVKGRKNGYNGSIWIAPFTFNSFRFTHNRGGKEWMSMGQTPRGESLAKRKQAKENDRKRNEPETGDKKLDGPNRPST
jgi:hypothetical protein